MLTSLGPLETQLLAYAQGRSANPLQRENL